MAHLRERFARLDVLDRASLIIIASLVPITALLALMPGLTGHVLAPHLDLVLDTTATIVTGSVAALLWVRFRESEQPVALFQSAAFLLLAAGNLVAIYVAVSTEGRTNEALVDDGQQQQYVFMTARLLAALMLVAGGVASFRGRLLAGTMRPRSPGAFLLAPLAILGAIVIVVEFGLADLPKLVVLGNPDGVPPQPDAALTPLGGAVQLAGAGLTMVAALVCRALWRRDGILGDAYLAFALVLASAAQVHAAIVPNFHPIQVSTSDGLWLAFGVTMLLGVEAEARWFLRSMRRANNELAVLRDAELDRAAAEERNRLSRELHDGLAQDLWFAKLKAARLAEYVPRGEAQELTDELSSGIDAALAEARQAVIALRVGPDGDHSLGSLLRRYVDDFAERFAIDIRFEGDRDLPRLPFRSEAELLRIAHEALTNAVRHADATVVRVRLVASDSELALSVSDNGRGFDTEALRVGSFGLRGMRERADILGGRFTVDTRPHDGTRVIVTVPLRAAQTLASA